MWGKDVSPRYGEDCTYGRDWVRLPHFTMQLLSHLSLLDFQSMLSDLVDLCKPYAISREARVDLDVCQRPSQIC